MKQVDLVPILKKHGISIPVGVKVILTDDGADGMKSLSVHWEYTVTSYVESDISAAFEVQKIVAALVARIKSDFGITTQLDEYEKAIKRGYGIGSKR